MILRVTFLSSALAALCGCASTIGGAVAISARTPSAFKMIRPGVSSSTCRFVLPWESASRRPPFDEAIDAITGLDPEIDTLINTSIIENRLGWWPVSWYCVTVTADAVRLTTAVTVPMIGHHH